MDDKSPLDPVSQALKLERLAGRIGSFETLLKSRTDTLELKVDDLKASLNHWSDEYERKRDEVEKVLSAEIRQVREALIRSVGIGSGLGLLAGLLVSGFLYVLNYRFSDIASDVDRAERSSLETRQSVDKAINDINEIKLFLARGGRVPDPPPQEDRSQAREQPSKPN